MPYPFQGGGNISELISTVEPTQRTDGNPLEVGDRWWNPNERLERSWSGSSWASLGGNDQSQIVSTTKPTTRDDSSALQVGDRWYKDDDGTSWFFNGTYWLSAAPTLVSTARLSFSGTATTMFTLEPFMPSGDTLIASVQVYTNRQGDATDHWTVEPGYGTNITSGFTSLASAKTTYENALTTGSFLDFPDINQALIITPSPSTIGLAVTQVGTPTSPLLLSATYEVYRIFQ